ncbi:MAG: ATP-dependent Clp protease ATP-binding subunit [Bacilli bacterium]|nr:ATP-dependent Clp protease ATP-binding subunit [Bacilli bacterium]
METLDINDTLINEEIIEPIDIIEENVENLNEDTNISDNYLNQNIKIQDEELENDVLEEEIIDEKVNQEEIIEEEVINNQVIDENKDIDVSNEVDEINLTKEIETINPSQESLDILNQYGENFSTKEYLTNPAIGRDEEIKQLIVTLLTPEKSAILVGKPGIGKTSIVEGLGYKIRNNDVPDALKGYSIYKLSAASLTGNMPETNELRIQFIVNHLKKLDKIIIFIDEIHTLIGNGENTLDFANIIKPLIDRGTIKVIGATTLDEYERYILRDKAFVRRFQKIEVSEPNREMVIQILMGTYPKFEQKMGLKLKYTDFIKENIMAFIVDATSEFKRVYETSVRYPDISLTLLQQAFSHALFNNKKEVSIRDIRKAIETTKLIYPDVIKKELVRFNTVFKDVYLMETKQILKDEV